MYRNILPNARGRFLKSGASWNVVASIPTVKATGACANDIHGDVHGFRVRN